MSQPLLPTSIGLFLFPDVKKSLSWFSGPSRNCSIGGWRFGVFMGGGEFKVFLRCPSEPPPRCKARHKTGAQCVCKSFPQGDPEPLRGVAKGECGDGLHRLPQGRGKVQIWHPRLWLQRAPWPSLECASNQMPTPRPDAPRQANEPLPKSRYLSINCFHVGPGVTPSMQAL